MSESLREKIARAMFDAGHADAHGPDIYEEQAPWWLECTDAAIAAIEAAGYAIVPLEPTGAMWSAGRSRFAVLAERYRQQTTHEAASAHADPAPDDIYRAMLAARPKP